jgi:hypothetical protein
MFIRARATSRAGVASILAAGLVLSLGWATSAAAQGKYYSLTGNTRAQIGNGLPLPITFAPIPKGKIIINGAVLQKGVAPMTMEFNKSALQWGPETATIPLFKANSNVFQLRTSLVINAPITDAVFKKSGRSGLPTFTWCPGQPLPLVTNPVCIDPVNQPANPNASIRYERTGNMFSGISQPGVSAPAGNNSIAAQLVLKFNEGAPCDGIDPDGGGPLPPPDPACQGLFSDIIPAATGVVGGPIGNAYINVLTPNEPNTVPDARREVEVDAYGNVVAVGAIKGPGLFNSVISFGAPWTTGLVTVWAPDGNEMYSLQGSDARDADGLGTISLVAGGVSWRALSDDNANRGWLNYTISRLGSAPSISDSGLVMLAVIFAGTSVWMIRRAVRPVA